MTTMIIDRSTLPETVSYRFASPRIAVIPQKDGDVMLSPVIDPADYDNDTDYLNAIPGMAELIIESMNAPASEFIDVPDEWIDRNV